MYQKYIYIYILKKTFSSNKWNQDFRSFSFYNCPYLISTFDVCINNIAPCELTGSMNMHLKQFVPSGCGSAGCLACLVGHYHVHHVS